LLGTLTLHIKSKTFLNGPTPNFLPQSSFITKEKILISKHKNLRTWLEFVQHWIDCVQLPWIRFNFITTNKKKEMVDVRFSFFLYKGNPKMEITTMRWLMNFLFSWQHNVAVNHNKLPFHFLTLHVFNFIKFDTWLSSYFWH
jgi:hypothetical protein